MKARKAAPAVKAHAATLAQSDKRRALYLLIMKWRKGPGLPISKLWDTARYTKAYGESFTMPAGRVAAQLRALDDLKRYRAHEDNAARVTAAFVGIPMREPGTFMGVDDEH